MQLLDGLARAARQLAARRQARRRPSPRVAAAICEHEPLTMVVSRQQYLNAREHLPADVREVEMTTDDSWMRDTGPTFVINDAGELRGVDWRFNAWGGLEVVCTSRGTTTIWSPGRCWRWKACRCTTPTSSSRAGPSMWTAGHGVDHRTMPAESQPESRVVQGADRAQPLQYLGADKVIWLPRGVYLDETDGHGTTSPGSPRREWSR